MALRGWYPDPAGTPGRYRFWTGNAWSAETTTDPGGLPDASAEPIASAEQPVEGRHGRGRPGILILAVLALLLVLLVGTVVVVRSHLAPSAEQPAPTSGRSGYDDSSPTPASPSPTDSAEPSVRAADCDLARPDQLSATAADGRVHGGPLSFRALPSPWTGAAATARFPLSRDSQEQTLPLPERRPWQASAQVGVVALNPYPGRNVAAESMLNCLLTSDFYTGLRVTVSRSTGSQLTVDGTPASRLESVLRFSDPRLTTKGSVVTIIVVDSSPVTYYFAAVPVERTDLIAALNRAVSSLALT